MANPATTGDIEVRWRTLTSDELSIAETRLDDAWRALKRVIPGIEARFVTEDDLQDTAIQVLADSVIRLLQFNAATGGRRKGAVTVDDGTHSWELDETIQSGLYFTDAELESLSGAAESFVARAYSVSPA